MKKMFLITLIICMTVKDNLSSAIASKRLLETTKSMTRPNYPNLNTKLGGNSQIPPGPISNNQSTPIPTPNNAQRNRRLQRLSHHNLNYNSPDIETQISSLNTMAERQLANARLRSARARQKRSNRRR